MSSPDRSSLGAIVSEGGIDFRVHSENATSVWLCLFDPGGEREIARLPMTRSGHVFHCAIAGAKAGRRYAFRADGPFDPANGHRFDPNKLLADPYATRIDRAWQWNPDLALPRGQSRDSAALVPKCIAENLPLARVGKPVFKRGGLIYEVNVRAFSRLYLDIPEHQRGTVAALRHPGVIAHLRKLGVSAVELMPVTASIDERHLPPLGLANAWGYNPVTFMALDPRLAPNGIADLRKTVDALHAEGIGVILDLVFNHTGESDEHGGTLSLRGLDNAGYYRHRDGRLVNDTGCGNTLACDRPAVRQMILDTLRHFVRHAGVDGFRFDLAPILGRDDAGFDAHAETLRAIVRDPLLEDRVLIAEPWDIGPDGYQLGKFSSPWLEWNDRYRDTVRRFWRGDATSGEFASAIAGSSDVFSGGATRSVNFAAAHDGFTLADLVAYENKHNAANGENNRDGHNENFSWNNGVEGATDDDAITEARLTDIMALLATLFVSRGTPMLTAGDEFGRTQHGNNNAYAQDNATTWIDWSRRDTVLEDQTAALSALRNRFGVLQSQLFFRGEAQEGQIADVEWLTLDGMSMTPAQWEDTALPGFAMVLATGLSQTPRLAVLFNRAHAPAECTLSASDGHAWQQDIGDGFPELPARSVAILVEHRTED